MTEAVIIHYHGTPITPTAQLLRMAGRHFCVSHAQPQSLKHCLRIAQSLMFDNGAFSQFTKGREVDLDAYYAWLEPMLNPPHWAVIPDKIDGDLADQQRLLASWPRETFGYANAAPVFHLHMPLHHLSALVLGYPRVCLGSSGQYWKIGTPAWCGRMDEIFNYLSKQFGRMPWIHGLRMLDQTDGGWPFASADSTNVAQNFKRDVGCAECKASPIDARQPAEKWTARAEQGTLSFEGTE